MPLLIPVLAIFFVIVIGSVFFFIIKYEKDADKKRKTYNDKLAKQNNYMSDELLPICKYDEGEKYPIRMVGIILTLIMISALLSFLRIPNYQFILMGAIIVIAGILLLVLLASGKKENIFLQYLKQNLNTKYTYLAEYDEKDNNEMVACCHRFGYEFAHVTSQYIEARVSEYQIKIGRNIFKDNGSMEYRSMLTVSNTIFAEITLSKNFEHSFFMSSYLGVIYTDDDSSIIPKYNIIPLIQFDKGNKEYVKNVMNDDLQEIIAKIASKVKRFSIGFYENKITISVPYTGILHSVSMSKRDTFDQDVLISIQSLADFLVDLAGKIVV